MSDGRWEHTEGPQLIARDIDIAPIGFATLYWTWQTLDAARIGVLNDLYVVPGSRGGGRPRADRTMPCT